jgi:CO/xanthine dehydrogenase FAD-binding subunit
MTGRPLVRRICSDPAGAVAAWAQELEGYEDLHASAAIRRDLFNNLAPDVIAEAQKCAA